jgi:hypothetical protein
MTIADLCDARMICAGGTQDIVPIRGIFDAECFDDRGDLKWRETFPNIVVYEGRNFDLDTLFDGIAYTVTGPFMGLISSIGFTAVSVNNTMASHVGWVEAGLANAPTYSGNRKTAVFTPASLGVKTLSPVLSFAITGDGTLKGAFIALGTGAVATIDTNTGKLWAAGLFASGDRLVHNGDVINASYSVSLA